MSLFSSIRRGLLPSLTPVGQRIAACVGVGNQKCWGVGSQKCWGKYVQAQTRLFCSSPSPPGVALPIQKIRNIAIIAHVDHGKTTLVDALLRSGGVQVQSNSRLMDQGEIEKERGITILAKTTRIDYKDHILNIVDTPGHSDFGGEVERVLSMVDGVVMVVDVMEGPMAQSRFVLKKALAEKAMVPIVFLNKVDRLSDKEPDGVENQIFDLFMSLEASDEQMDYPMLFGSAKGGWVERSWEDCNKTEHHEGVSPLLDQIIAHVPHPKPSEHHQPDLLSKVSLTDVQFLRNPVTPDFSMLVSIIEGVPGAGLCFTGKVYSGLAMKDGAVHIIPPDGSSPTKTRLKAVYTTAGIEKTKCQFASTGDIVTLDLTGNHHAPVHSTITASPSNPALPFHAIDPPVIGVNVSVNTSPLRGLDGKFSTLNDVSSRLKKEALSNVGLTVTMNAVGSSVSIYGRGELQLGVLFETMRREGYEFEIAPPQIVLKKSAEGKLMEPWERYTITFPRECAPKVTEMMMLRNAELVNSTYNGDFVEFVYECASRQFFGAQVALAEVCTGRHTLNSEVIDHRLYRPSEPQGRKSLGIATHDGVVSSVDLLKHQNECRFFVLPGDVVYEGMVIGDKDGTEDLLINVTKGKKAQIMTQKTKDAKEAHNPVMRLTIEYLLSFIHSDEAIEVTPRRIVLRKKVLDNAQRRKNETSMKKKADFMVA